MEMRLWIEASLPNGGVHAPPCCANGLRARDTL